MAESGLECSRRLKAYLRSLAPPTRTGPLLGRLDGSLKHARHRIVVIWAVRVLELFPEVGNDGVPPIMVELSSLFVTVKDHPSYPECTRAEHLTGLSSVAVNLGNHDEVAAPNLDCLH
jgi:hypothetical protein